MVWVYFSLPDVDKCGGVSSLAGVARPPVGAAAFAAMPEHLRYPAAGLETRPALDLYTVLLNSYRRPDLLKRSLEHYRQCTQADAIRVIWSEDGPAPPSDEVDVDGHASEGARRAEPGGAMPLPAPVVYDVQPNASLNNRFRPPPGLRTEAVLSLRSCPTPDVTAGISSWPCLLAQAPFKCSVRLYLTTAAPF
jgi:hypothetical protein